MEGLERAARPCYQMKPIVRETKQNIYSSSKIMLEMILYEKLKV